MYFPNNRACDSLACELSLFTAKFTSIEILDNGNQTKIYTLENTQKKEMSLRWPCCETEVFLIYILIYI